MQDATCRGYGRNDIGQVAIQIQPEPSSCQMSATRVAALPRAAGFTCLPITSDHGLSSQGAGKDLWVNVGVLLSFRIRVGAIIETPSSCLYLDLPGPPVPR